MQPLVSVVIPTYNRAGIIGATIQNVLDQSYRRIELIVVDDGSKDDTLAQLRKFGGQIRIIAQQNSGPAVARNRGARAAQGEFIAFQDSDDLWEPTKLARQVALLMNCESAPVCICNTQMGIVDGKPWTAFEESCVRPRYAEGVWLNVSEVLATRFLLFNQAAMIRRKAFEATGGFREDLRYLEDYDLPLRLSLLGPWTFIKDPLVRYGVGAPESFSKEALKNEYLLRDCGVKIFETVLSMVEQHPGRAGLSNLLRKRLRLLRWLRTAAEMKQRKTGGARFAAKFLIIAEHYYRAIFRHSPWFPQPITVPAQLETCAPPTAATPATL